MFTLHEYQTEAKAKVYESWKAGDNRPAIILATGMGKTVIFSSITSDLVSESASRVLILVHRDELVMQTAAKLQAFSGVKSVGVVKGQQNETDAQVIVGSVQTLYRQSRLDSLLAQGPIDYVICDELHHFASASNRRLLTGLGVIGGKTKAAGFTATFVRHDSKKLANDWTPVYEKTVAWAIEHNFLVDLQAIEVQVPDLDLDNVKRSSDGDLGDAGLGAALQNSEAATLIPRAWKEYAAGRKTILFAPTIASCEDLVAGLRAADIKTEAVYGTTPIAERRAIYDRVRSGVTSVLASVGVLTEGFDMPEISAAILARPTESRGLYQQMVGRVLRLFPGKDDAVLLDIVGTSSSHDLCNITDLKKAHDEEKTEEEKTPAACECLGLCGCDMLRGQCTKMQNIGLCLCQGCDCPSSGERGAISVIKGKGDRHVDLFKGSGSVWLTTYAGTWFIPTRHAYVVVLESKTTPGLYRPARTNDQNTVYGPAMGWVGPEADLETAMKEAQNYASLLDPFLVKKDSSWRRKKPSDGQLWKAGKCGIRVEDGMKSGPISDAISRYEASHLIDPALAGK